MEVAVTTSQDDAVLITRAQGIAEELGISYVPRNKRSLNRIRKEHGLDYLLVVERNNLALKGETLLTWHPGMAVPRIKALREGKTDHLVEAMGLKPGYHVLDCTLGLGADALVAAYAVGPEGHVTGLEENKYIAFLTRWGMSHFAEENKHILPALERITVLNRDYLDYLRSRLAESIDVVYFDPMFRSPMIKSSSINALRPLAGHEPLSPEAIREALRVARRRVVMKETAKTREFDRLQVHYKVGGNYSPHRLRCLGKRA